MTRSNKKALWIALAAVAACVIAIAVTLTVILTKPNDSHVTVEPPENPNYPVVGELDVKLVRERLDGKILDKNNGLPKSILNDDFTDFSASSKNVFGLDNDVLIAPGCYFSADMEISNTKPYAFEYWLEIVPENGGNLLVDQLELTVTIDGEIFVQRTLSDGLITKVFPSVAANEKAKFTVKLQYLDVQNNDETKNTTLAFDMTVHARLIQS